MVRPCRAKITGFAWLSAKNNPNARHRKPSFFCLKNAKIASNGAQSPRGLRKNRGFAAEKPLFVFDFMDFCIYREGSHENVFNGRCMLHFAYFVAEFRGIPPREPPVSHSTELKSQQIGREKGQHVIIFHCQVGICIAVSCRFSLCAVELPASCAGAAADWFGRLLKSMGPLRSHPPPSCATRAS